jgi:hypothetical protein
MAQDAQKGLTGKVDQDGKYHSPGDVSTMKEEDIVNPIDLEASQEEKVKQLEEMTKENKPILDRFLKELDEKLGIESNTNVKKSKAILEKANRPEIKAKKPWHNVEHIRDSLRFKSKIDNIGQTIDIFNALKQAGMKFVKIDTKKMFKPKGWGWRFVGFDLRMPNGQIVEYYFTVKELEAKGVKDVNHVLYSDWRGQTEEYIEANKAAYERAITESYNRYNDAFNSYLSRVGESLTEAFASFAKVEAILGSETGVKSSLSSSAPITPVAQTPLVRTAAKSAAPSKTNILPASASKTSMATPPSKKKVAQKPAKGKPQVIRTAISKIRKMQERLKDPDIKRRAEVEEERRAIVSQLNKSKLLPTFARRRMVDALNKMRGISTPEGRERLSKFLDFVADQIELVQKKKDLIENIKERQLKRVDNLRKAAKLPPIKKMNAKQLDEFVKMLEPYQDGDIFLSQRQIETVDNTDLKGIRTRREAQERLAKEAGVPVEELNKIKVSGWDRFTYDVRLAGKNPLYKLLVEGTHAAFLQGDLAFRKLEQKLNDLTNKARASRKRGFLDVLIPTDKLVFDWLSAAEKTEIEEKMTKQELELALFLQDEYAKALEYLIKQETLKTGRDNYITNVRRGFLEALKEDGLKAALKEIFDAHKIDAQIFNILDSETDMILPLEKFFQFAMRRTGEINPSKNVAKAASQYFQTLYKKTALDSIIPKMTIYAQVMTPLKTTQRGLEFDRSIVRFVKEWINTKKGRKSNVWFKQGSPVDIALLTLKSLVTIWDLGINIPVQVAAGIGELTAGYVTLGKRNFVKGIERIASKKGREIVKKYEGFVGKSLWQEIAEPAKDIGDRFMTAILGGFEDSATRMNKISLLGMMTDAEYEAGEISKERLSQIKLEMGKMRPLSGFKSIEGATTAGGLWTHYKSWAVPIINSFARDIRKLGAKMPLKEKLKTEELVRLGREVEILTAALLLFTLATVDDDDKTFVGQLMKKAKREAFTILGALDVRLWATIPRLQAWAFDMADALGMLMALEKYKDEDREGELKGLNKLKRLLTPRAAAQFMTEE